MVLKFGIILDSDFHSVGQSPTPEGFKTQALFGAKDVKFSYVFTNMGLSCLSMLM